MDLLELVLSAGSSARAAFPGRQIDVVNEAADLPLVKGDPDRLHQVLLNLVSNALRHGGVESAGVGGELFGGGGAGASVVARPQNAGQGRGAQAGHQDGVAGSSTTT